MRPHPAAEIFPLDESNIDSLADDIRTNGQQVPIEICDGMILDGRRRWEACCRVGVVPTKRTVSPADPVAYVLSLNLHRRHLTTSQLAMVAARARSIYDEQAKERQRLSEGRGQKGPVNLPDLKTDSRDAAGRAVGVSGKSVDYATRVLTQAEPEVVRAVDEGRMSVSTAAILAVEPPEVQKHEAEFTSTGRRRVRTYTNGPYGAGEPDHKPETEPEPGESRGVGVRFGNEAIDCLKRIPKNDGLRKRGFQIVTDWIRLNK